ncbi:MAG: hemolysin family protein [Actinomycetota bacterium]|jgi:putative hemolysin|nr:hemolysin family protein [Actinomycetota bacterium]
MEQYIVEIILILALILLNGYFAAAEIALISARRAALKAAADTGSSGAAAAVKLTEDPTRLLATIQIGITLVGFMASAAAAVSLATPLAEWLRSLGSPWLAGAAGGLSVVFVTVAIAYLTLVIGELAPKRLGLQRAESVAIAVARPVTVLARFVAPLVWFLGISTDLVSRMIGVKLGAGRPGVTEEEIKLLVTEQGTLLDEEKRMIHEKFELGDTVAREIMVPRVDMVLAEEGTGVAEALEIFRTSGFSRLPVFRGDHDTIVGVVLLKDMVGPVASDGLVGSVDQFMRDAVFVPETKRILPLLSEMQARHNHMSIVVDEYGGTAGLVTIEDIVEEIIGEVADEFDTSRRFVTPLRDNEWVIDGNLPVEEAVEMALPVEESDEYETLAGWMLSCLGHIPVQGERVEREGHSFTVQAVRRRRIARVHVVRGETLSREMWPGGEANGA